MNRKDTIDRLYEIEEKIPRNLQLDKYDKEAITSARQTLEKPSCVCLMDLLQIYEIYIDEMSSVEDTLRIYFKGIFISADNYGGELYSACKSLGILYKEVNYFEIHHNDDNRPQLRIFLDDTEKGE